MLTPRALVHYFGVLAPNAKLRQFVVPESLMEEDQDPCGHSITYEQATTGQTIRRRWFPWAALLLKVIAVDVLARPRWASRMQRIFGCSSQSLDEMILLQCNG